jgi:hypothetical protein
LNRYAIRRHPVDDHAKQDDPAPAQAMPAAVEAPLPPPDTRELPRDLAAADTASASKPRRRILTVKKNS